MSESRFTSLSLAGRTPRKTLAPMPWVTTALGAAVYVACAIGVHVWIVQQPRPNVLVAVALIVALTLGLVTALEGLLRLLAIAREEHSFGWPYRAACLAGIAYSVTYGPYVFINLWWADDWGYLAWGDSFTPDLLTKTLNDHLSPLLNVILWTTNKTFGLDYIGIACLQHGVFVLLLLSLAHIFWTALKWPRALVFFLVTYACWPTHGDARFWLGGGFWLSASAAFLMLYLLHALSRLTNDEKPLMIIDLSISLVLAAMTVFISSQTMIPGVYLLCLVAPLIAVAQQPGHVARRIGMLAGLSLVPTAVIFIARRVYVQRSGFDLSGVIEGDLIRNVFLFFSEKVVMMRGDIHKAKYQLESAAVFAVLFAAPVALAIGVQFDKWRKGDISNPTEWAARLGLVLLGCGLIGVLFIQIGAARNWLTEAVLASYYATLPLLAYWLALFGAFATLAPAAASWSWAPRWRGSAMTATVGIVLIVQVALAFHSIHKHEPLQARMEASQGQRDFLDQLGAAMCSLAADHPGQRVTWRPKYLPGTDCPSCTTILSPPDFLGDGRFVLTLMAGPAARRSCSSADADLVTLSWANANADNATDGADNRAVRRFYDTYFVTQP
jgi:hypothetical protein